MEDSNVVEDRISQPSSHLSPTSGSVEEFVNLPSSMPHAGRLHHSQTFTAGIFKQGGSGMQPTAKHTRHSDCVRYSHLDTGSKSNQAGEENGCEQQQAGMLGERGRRALRSSSWHPSSLRIFPEAYPLLAVAGRIASSNQDASDACMQNLKRFRFSESAAEHSAGDSTGELNSANQHKDRSCPGARFANPTNVTSSTEHLGPEAQLVLCSMPEQAEPELTYAQKVCTSDFENVHQLLVVLGANEDATKLCSA
jgi:hypothetical protein